MDVGSVSAQVNSLRPAPEYGGQVIDVHIRCHPVRGMTCGTFTHLPIYETRSYSPKSNVGRGHNKMTRGFHDSLTGLWFGVLAFGLCWLLDAERLLAGWHRHMHAHPHNHTTKHTHTHTRT